MKLKQASITGLEGRGLERARLQPCRTGTEIHAALAAEGGLSPLRLPSLKQALIVTLVMLAMQGTSANAQNAAFTMKSPQSPLVKTGQVMVEGRATPYIIRHLPVSSFPALPRAVQDELNRRSCMIPQTYEAHRPENVAHADFEGRGGTDWAVLCAVKGTVSLLVFFDGGSLPPAVLASVPETERLQVHDVSGVLGFNWGIDPASPRQVAEAQYGMSPRPPVLDHDALADTIVEHKTVYHFYAENAWTMVKLRN